MLNITAGSQKGVCDGAHLSRRAGQLHLRGWLDNSCLLIDRLTLQQNVYLLGTSLARPVIARGMIAIADKEGCE